MTTLYLLRHGVAVERGAAGHRDDAKRPLTPKGEKKVRQTAKALRRLKVEFDMLLTSPFERALRTAQIVAQVFGAKKKLEVCDELAVGGDPKVIIDRIRRRHTAETVMLVGHEPYLSELASVLLTGRAGLPLDLKKGGLCKLSVPRLHYGRGATLEWLLAPRVLAGKR